MDISIEELYMLLGVKDAQIYKLQQELRNLKDAQVAALLTPPTDLLPLPPTEPEN